MRDKMSNDKESLKTGFRKIFDALLSNIHTAMPGIIKSFDVTTGLATVQPALQRKFSGSESAIDLPVIEDVLVLFPGNNDYIITFEISVDLPVLLIFSERAIDIWQNIGGVVDPAIQRKFDLSDCIAIPHLMPLPNLPLVPIETGCISIRKKDNSLFLKLSDKVEILGDLEVTGNIVATGDITGVEIIIPPDPLAVPPILGLTLSTHIHGGVTTGPGSTAGPTQGT